MRRHFLTYLTFATIGFSQPLLDLYGKNVTIFSAAHLSQMEIVVFLLIVLLFPAVVAVACDAASRRFGARLNDRIRLAILGVMALFIGLAVARWLSINNDIASIAVALTAAIALPWAFHRSRGFRQWTRVASLLALVVGVMAIVQLRPAFSVATGDPTDAVVGRQDLSVLLIVLDELPFYGVLDDDGHINAERFPGLAELADGSTWYRDAIATSNFTHQAVPAIFASEQAGGSSRPFLYDHPRNIFTLFDGVMDLTGIEPVTDLCPAHVCDENSSTGVGVSLSRLTSFLSDAGVVYLHRTMPPFVRDRLPSIDGTWGGFGGVADDFLETAASGPLAQSDAIFRAAATISNSQRASVQIVHAMLPHFPWVLTPDERITGRAPEISLKNPADVDGVRDNYQAALHQLAAADAAVARSVGELKTSGRWDDTMVVLVADHGISFLPGQLQRRTTFVDRDQADDIYRVPFFVKYPGQREGVVSDCPVTTLDVLPTIIDVLDVTTSWTFDGASLAGECPVRRTRVAMSASGEEAEFSGGFADLRARSDHYDALVRRQGPAHRIAAVGEAGELVGAVIPSGLPEATGVTWKLDQWIQFVDLSPERGTFVPAQVTGFIETREAWAEGTEGIIVANGVGVGVVGEVPLTAGRAGYTAILDYSQLTSRESYTLELYLRSPDGALRRAAWVD